MSAQTITSRVGRAPITIPKGVEVKLNDNKLSAKGPKGLLEVDVHPFVSVSIADDAVTITYDEENKGVLTGRDRKTYRSIPGTTRSNISNAIKGVSEGFEVRLNLVGVGYRAQSKGKLLSLSLGFSHPTDYALPEGVTAETPSQTEIVVKGANKILVGEVARQIRAIRPPEPYKGKGVRYAGEHIELKETKKK